MLNCHRLHIHSLNQRASSSSIARTAAARAYSGGRPSGHPRLFAHRAVPDLTEGLAVDVESIKQVGGWLMVWGQRLQEAPTARACPPPSLSSRCITTVPALVLTLLHNLLPAGSEQQPAEWSQCGAGCRCLAGGSESCRWAGGGRVGSPNQLAGHLRARQRHRLSSIYCCSAAAFLQPDSTSAAAVTEPHEQGERTHRRGLSKRPEASAPGNAKPCSSS